MKTETIMQKIARYKEKMVNMQMKLNCIEKKVQYKDIDTFGIYKPLIESGLEDLDFMLLSLEANIENISSMISGGCAFCELGDLDIEKMMTEQLKYSEKFIKPTVKEVEEKMDLAVEGVLTYETI